MEKDRKSTRLNSSHSSISYTPAPSLHDALPIFPRIDHARRRAQSKRHGRVRLFLVKEYVRKTGERGEEEHDPEKRGLENRRKLARTERESHDHERRDGERSEEHTSELQSQFHLVYPSSFPTRRSSDLSPHRSRPAARTVEAPWPCSSLPREGIRAQDRRTRRRRARPREARP